MHERRMVELDRKVVQPVMVEATKYVNLWRCVEGRLLGMYLEHSIEGRC